MAAAMPQIVIRLWPPRHALVMAKALIINAAMANTQQRPMALSPCVKRVMVQLTKRVEMYNQPSVTANCPAGTTAQSDGTCLQGGSVSSYTSSYSPSYVTSGGSVENCPAGTASQADGTCLQGGSISSYSSSSYTGPTYSSLSSLDTAPALSTYDFGNYNWGSKDTTWGSDSYVSPGSRIVDGPNHYPSTSETPTYGYMPSRK